MGKLLLLAAICLSFGCASKMVKTTDLFIPMEYVTKELPEYSRMPHGKVFAINGKKESLKFAERAALLGGPRDVALGHIFFGGEPVTPGIARKVAAACGGDRYVAASVGDPGAKVNLLWVMASPALTRELWMQGFLTVEKKNPEKPSKKPGTTSSQEKQNLLLNDSTL